MANFNDSNAPPWLSELLRGHEDGIGGMSHGPDPITPKIDMEAFHQHMWGEPDESVEPPAFWVDKGRLLAAQVYEALARADNAGMLPVARVHIAQQARQEVEEEARGDERAIKLMARGFRNWEFRNGYGY